MCDPSPRTEDQSLPSPPAYFERRALSLMALKMPARSSSTVVRKQDDNCGRSVPELNSVGVEAMKFSIQLVRGHWWRTLGIFAVTAIIVIVFYVLAIALVAIAVQFARGADIALVTAAATVLIIALSAFVTPLIAAMVLAVFGDLEVRHAAAPGF